MPASFGVVGIFDLFLVVNCLDFEDTVGACFDGICIAIILLTKVTSLQIWICEFINVIITCKKLFLK